MPIVMRNSQQRETHVLDAQSHAPGREVPIGTLVPGSRFRLLMELSGREFKGTLLYKTSGSATVVLDGIKKESTFYVAEGGKVVIRQMNGPVHWSLGALVYRLNEPRVDVEALLKSEKEKEREDTNMAVALPGSKNGKGKAVKSAAKSAAAVNPCMCGCGTKVRGRFAVGHDGRFYSQLRKVAAGNIGIGELNKHMQGIVKSKAGAKQLLDASGH